MLAPGTQAPDIVLNDQQGKSFSLSSLRGRKNAVVFFYPKDDTSICTKEACAFRDSYTDFAGKDTVVIGISDDDAISHMHFAEKWKLNFLLLSDAQGVARTAYGVNRWMGLLKGRATFVIDMKGVIRAVINDRFNAERHVKEALAAL